MDCAEFIAETHRPRHAADVRNQQRQHEERPMRLKARLYLSVAAIGIAALLAAPPAQLSAQQDAAPGVTVGADDLGGVVRGPNGPEAGVWVIAETSDLPTKFAKIVVTDEQGRYVIPELPK